MHIIPQSQKIVLGSLSLITAVAVLLGMVLVWAGAGWLGRLPNLVLITSVILAAISLMTAVVTMVWGIGTTIRIKMVWLQGLGVTLGVGAWISVIVLLAGMSQNFLQSGQNAAALVDSDQEGQISSSQSMVGLINQARLETGLEPLKESAKLRASAIDKACDMVERNYFGHIDPDGKEAWYLYDRHGYPYAFAGENLIEGFPSEEVSFQKLMQSETHRQNILSDRYTDIGIGHCGNYTVQHFGRLQYD